jgi:hypothetical protein
MNRWFRYHADAKKAQERLIAQKATGMFTYVVAPATYSGNRGWKVVMAVKVAI